jgi:HD-GYP domain-containing protein (c-di-GMP phosphodiesterase class II)
MTHVADVYDALRTHRPYRAALDHEKIVDLMTRDRGTVFAADILDVFFERVVPRAVRR